MEIKKITIYLKPIREDTLNRIGDDEEWFLIVDKIDSQDRGWLIGKKEQVEAIIKLLTNL